MPQRTTRSLRRHATRGTALLVTAFTLFATGPVDADSIAQGTSQATTVQSPASEAVKESAITAKVKARFAARHFGSLTTVRVNTDKDGIVWLSGTVSTVDACALAGQIAKDTEGVIAVHNAIVVR
jgi:hyperosmotically inducible periplasmic protein